MLSEGYRVVKRLVHLQMKHALEQTGYWGPFGKGGGQAAVVGWTAVCAAGKGTNLGFRESDERNRWGGTRQGFEALFLGFLCIGKFLKSKQKE